MTKTSGNIWAASNLLMALVSPVSATAAIHSELSSPTITVRVLDLAQVGGDTLDRAKAVTEGVFRPMGIKIKWLQCFVGDTRQDLACPAAVGPNDMSLRILRHKMANYKKMRSSTAGAALPLAPRGGKGIIYLYFDRVIEVQNSQKQPLELVMGIIIAHEMGHLLLPGEPHALAGIMRGNLEPIDWQLAAQCRLGFTYKQKEIIMAGIRARSSKRSTEAPTGQITSH